MHKFKEERAPWDEPQQYQTKVDLKYAVHLPYAILPDQAHIGVMPAGLYEITDCWAPHFVIVHSVGSRERWYALPAVQLAAALIGQDHTENLLSSYETEFLRPLGSEGHLVGGGPIIPANIQLGYN